ncbi:CG31928 [Drosophila busckii]|uniref:CG31928 n=1 Tax=Drosophila busckii TaxID=30019 RepID=A0A0M4ENF2_DROBS|nr:lysosomal aspartic protease [Drosophila busckii]ALC37957.1 CG31928 [Drosophila busckii]
MHWSWLQNLVVAVVLLQLPNSTVVGRQRPVTVSLKRLRDHESTLSTLQFEKAALKAKFRVKSLQRPMLMAAGRQVEEETPRLPLGNAYNTEYYGLIQVGSAQSFKILFDTASSNLWVPSIQCPADNCTRMHRYDSSLSSTHVPNGNAFQIQYATRNNQPTILKGFLSTDDVSIAGLTIKKQTFAEITSLPPGVFSKANFDGIFGLGFKDIAIGGITPPFTKMVEQGLVSQPTFSIYLNRNNTGSIDANGGKLLLGPSDPTLYSGCMTYVPLSKVGYWQFTTRSIRLGSSNLLCSNCEAIVDVGTSLIVAPIKALRSINAQLGLTEASKRDGVYTLPCSRVPLLPSITFNIGRRDFVIPASSYIVQYKSTCVSGFTSLEEGSQELTDDSGTDYSNLWIFGDVFMGPFYMEFDMEYKRIGLARKV